MGATTDETDFTTSGKTPDPSSGSVVGETADPAADRREKDRAYLAGMAWVGTARWAAQMVSWTALPVVAALLRPEDYGLYGMAMLFVGLMEMVCEFGVGSAVIYTKEVSPAKNAAMQGTAVLVGLGCAACSLVAAPVVQWFFAAPGLAMLVAVSGASFLFLGVQTVPHALLRREGHFRTVSLVVTARTLLQATLLLTLAATGFGAWSFALSNLAGIALQAVGMCAARPVPFAWPRGAGLHAERQFGRRTAIGSLCWYFYSNADFMVASKLFQDAQHQLGLYSFAWTLASMPVEKISVLVLQVVPTIFTQQQGDLPGLRRYFLLIIKGLAALTLPACWGLALVAGELLPIIDEQWRPAIVPMQMLAFYSVIRSLSPLLTPLLQALGDAGFEMRVNVLALLLFPTAFVLFGSLGGLIGLALAWMIVDPLIVAYRFRRVQQRTGLGWGEVLAALTPALQGGLIMAAAVMLTGVALEGQPLLLVLVVKILVGAGAYTGYMVAAQRSTLEALYRLIRPPAEANAGTMAPASASSQSSPK